MKVVLFCGGFGTRFHDSTSSCPKPMAQIGYRPILWHIMKYYAHFGHRDFVLCLGWKANEIKEYFLKYDECISNDFVLSSGGGEIQLLNTDIQDWNITFVDTGVTATIAERLKAVEPHVRDEDVFLANYADGLTDLHLPDLIDFFHAKGGVGAFLSVQPEHNSFHAVETDDEGLVCSVEPIDKIGVWMNGGFFVFSPEIFDYIEKGQELVEQPFARLIEEKRLYSYRYDGFWGCMDTFKEKAILDEMYTSGSAPWEVWKRPGRGLNGDTAGGALPKPVPFTPKKKPSPRRGSPAMLKKA